MKLWLAALHIILVGTNLWVTAHFHEDSSESENEFAEFEDFEEDKPLAKPTPEQFMVKKTEINDFDQDDAIIEDVDNEFDHFQDEEEFEGLDSSSNKGPKIEEPSTLTITKVPLHLRSRWDSFYLEILMITGLLVYFVNYLTGKSKNYNIAESWYRNHRQMLLDNFSLVGDTGRPNDDALPFGPLKESESQYTIYCSGRVGCDSMLIEMKLIKRQDLVAVIAQMMRPVNDQIHLRIEMSKEDMDNFVLAVATKKTAMHMVRDMADVSAYCPEKRPGEKYDLPSGFLVMSEIAEASSAILDSRVVQAFNKYAQFIDYIHISDQYSGPKQQE